VRVEGFSGRGSRSNLESPDVWEETCDICGGTGRRVEDDDEELDEE